MYRSIAVAVIALGAVACAAGSSAAQSERAEAGYLALTTTPTGGLVPIVRPWMAGGNRRVSTVDARWGRFEDGFVTGNNAVVGISIPNSDARGDIALSGGYFDVQCEECGGLLQLGVALERELIHQPIVEHAGQFGAGVSAAVGYGDSGHGTTWSVALGTPLFVAFGTPGQVQLVPFLTPSLGWGSVRPEEGDPVSGVRFMAGGGIGLVNMMPGVSINVGFQKTFIEQGATVFGLGLSYAISR
jgi:hypothetical protein